MQSLESYRSFYHAALHENFSQAARDLFVSQSSISQAVARLEEDLGVLLFHRRGRRISLTEEGHLLKEKLDVAFSAMEEAHRLIQSTRNLERGSLRIAASDTICRHFLLESLAEFHRNYPAIRLDINNQPSPRVMQLLDEASADLGLVIATDEEVQAYQAIHLKEVPEVFFTRKSGEEKKALTKQDIKSRSMVTLGPQSSTRRLLDHLLQEEEQTFLPSVEVISIDLMIDLIDAGFGLGFSYRDLLGDRHHIFDTDFDIPKRHLWILKNPRQPESKSELAFQSILMKSFAISENPSSEK